MPAAHADAGPGLSLRALDTLPPGPPPHVRPRWERPARSRRDARQVWSKEICRGLALAACSDRLPIWLRIGIQQFVSGQIVIRFAPPLEIQGIAKWIGHDPQSFDLRDLSQTHVEKQEELAACFGEWQYWAVNWLKQCRPAELAAILSTRPARSSERRRVRLGSARSLLGYLRHHVETDYDRGPPRTRATTRRAWNCRRRGRPFRRADDEDSAGGRRRRRAPPNRR